MRLFKALWIRLYAFGGLIAEFFAAWLRTRRAIEADEDGQSACADGAVAVSFPRGSDSYRDRDLDVRFSPITASRADEPYHEDDQT